MRYLYSQTDRSNLEWFEKDTSKATLMRFEIGDGEIRGLSKLTLQFRYPITAISGKNSTGKSTILACVACAFHNRPSGFRPFNRRIPYYTFSDFFIQAAEEEPLAFVWLRYQILYDNWRKTRNLRSGVGIQKRINVLASLIELIDTELGFAARPTKVKEDFWSLLHPAVTQVAKSRFEAGHYADAVEAALKDLNLKIKAYVRKTSGQEFDGSDLMQRAFSPNSPIVRLADLSTDDGRNIQQGYMQIFAGTMTGIRNPKAHSNIVIDAQRAVHHLHLVSLLAFIFDERL